MNKRTADEYYNRLSIFEKFILSQYNIIIDEFINDLLKLKFDPYEALGNYCIYLQERGLQTSTLKNRVITVKNFLEFNDVDISPRKFKLKVRFPKNIRRIREALDKNDIINILNSCSEIRLKTYVMLLASTGMRATEALSIRLKDLDLESSFSNYPIAKVAIRGEYTKTKVDRYVFLTTEMIEQLKKWLDFKYRTRRVCYKDKITGKTICEYRTPEKKQNEFIFSLYQTEKPSPEVLYDNLATVFAKTLDRIGMGSREDGNETRREITLHSFRRFVKTTISDLGYSDYSEWYIGHAGSTYWRKKDSENAEIFKKIEPYLTFLNITQLTRQGADLETKVEELTTINQELRQKNMENENRIRLQIESRDEEIQSLREEMRFLRQMVNRMVSSPL